MRWTETRFCHSHASVYQSCFPLDIPFVYLTNGLFHVLFFWGGGLGFNSLQFILVSVLYFLSPILVHVSFFIIFVDLRFLTAKRFNIWKFKALEDVHDPNFFFFF
jgi:hypothetical protein